MAKYLILLILIGMNLNISAGDYLVTVVFGAGMNREYIAENKNWLAHLIPLRGSNHSTVYLTHHKSEQEFNQIIQKTNCHSEGENKELIILAQSWGAQKGLDLAKKYHKECNKEVKAFYLVDAVQKPTPFSFKKKPKAQSCTNYYQRLSTLKGKSIKGCTNIEISKDCDQRAHESNKWNSCHIEASEYAFEVIAQEINRQYLN